MVFHAAAISILEAGAIYLNFFKHQWERMHMRQCLCKKKIWKLYKILMYSVISDNNKQFSFFEKYGSGFPKKWSRKLNLKHY